MPREHQVTVKNRDRDSSITIVRRTVNHVIVAATTLPCFSLFPGHPAATRHDVIISLSLSRLTVVLLEGQVREDLLGERGSCSLAPRRKEVKGKRVAVARRKRRGRGRRRKKKGEKEARC